MSDQQKPPFNGLTPIVVGLAKYVAAVTASVAGAIAVTDAYGQDRTGTVLQWLWSLTGWQPPMSHEVAANIVITLIATGFLAICIVLLVKK